MVDLLFSMLDSYSIKYVKYYCIIQCFGSGSGRIRIIGQDPDPDPYQETLIWIRVPKKNRDKHAYKSTKIIEI